MSAIRSPFAPASVRLVARLRPAGTTVEVWLADTTGRSDEVPSDGWGLLVPQDLRDLERLTLLTARAEFACGRAVLRHVLSGYLRRPPEQLAISRSPTGRPYLVDAAGWDFNLSHTPGLIALAVGRWTRVGIDVERVRPLPAADAVAARHLSAADRTRLAHLEGTARLTEWFRAWTRLEAIVKARGTGVLRCGQNADFPMDAGAQLPVPPGYVGSVAVLPTPAPVWSVAS